MKYSIDIKQFEKMRKGRFVYMDKTAQVYQLQAIDKSAEEALQQIKDSLMTDLSKPITANCF